MPHQCPVFSSEYHILRGILTNRSVWRCCQLERAPENRSYAPMLDSRKHSEFFKLEKERLPLNILMIEMCPVLCLAISTRSPPGTIFIHSLNTSNVHYVETWILSLLRENLKKPDLATHLFQSQVKLLVTPQWVYALLSCDQAITPFSISASESLVFCMLWLSSRWCYHLSASPPGFLCLIHAHVPCHCAGIDITLRTSSLWNCWLWRLFHLSDL